MFYTRDFLNSIAEKCRKDYCRTDDEKAGSDQREYMLGDSVLARVHLDVYLECGYDRKTSCNRVNDVLDASSSLRQSRASKPMRLRPVIHAAALAKTARQQHEDWSYCFFDVPSRHSSSIAGFMVTPPMGAADLPIINLYSSAELWVGKWLGLSSIFPQSLWLIASTTSCLCCFGLYRPTQTAFHQRSVSHTRCPRH